MITRSSVSSRWFDLAEVDLYVPQPRPHIANVRLSLRFVALGFRRLVRVRVEARARGGPRAMPRPIREWPRRIGLERGPLPNLRDQELHVLALLVFLPGGDPVGSQAVDLSAEGGVQLLHQEVQQFFPSSWVYLWAFPVVLVQ